MEERVALPSRERAGDGRFKAEAVFALLPLVRDRREEPGKRGLALPQRHRVDFQMLLKDVLGMEGGVLASPYAVNVRKDGPDPSRDCDAVSVVSEGMEREPHQPGIQLGHASRKAVVIQVESVTV
jgi:hypothetical protein